MGFREFSILGGVLESPFSQPCSRPTQAWRRSQYHCIRVSLASLPTSDELSTHNSCRQCCVYCLYKCRLFCHLIASRTSPMSVPLTRYVGLCKQHLKYWSALRATCSGQKANSHHVWLASSPVQSWPSSWYLRQDNQVTKAAKFSQSTQLMRQWYVFDNGNAIV